MTDGTTYAVAGAAVAMPAVLALFARQGAIPVFVAPSQRAALARLDALFGVATSNPEPQRYSAFNRWNELRHALVVKQGTVKGLPTEYPAMDPLADPSWTSQLDELCAAFLDAVKAGLDAEDGQGRYELGNDGAPDLRDAVWARLLDGDTWASMTELGKATAEVVRVRKSLSFIAQDVPNAWKATGNLAVEMDDCGYLITGAPPTIDWSVGPRWVKDKLEAAGLAALGALANAAFYPALVVGGGYLVYRAVKS
jgi:hypothetical protein